MGLIRRLFGYSDAPAGERGPVRDATSHEAPAVRLQGLGIFALEAVGESRYQDVLERICGGRTEEGVDKFVDAVIVCEHDNPYDQQAVRIDISGLTVGYLSREHARVYRQQMGKAGHGVRTAICAARIQGGWYRGDDDQGAFGVRLDVAIL
jgi:hypothetical protein